MERRPGKLLHIILVYVAISGITFWLPTIRGLFDGSSYTWSGWLGIGGSGVSGEYWLLLVFTALLITVLFLGWRGGRRPFHWLLLLWFLLLLMESGSWYFAEETIYFRGDTLGSDLPIGKIIFPLDLLFFILSVIWVIRNRKTSDTFITPIRNKMNQLFIVIFFCMMPIEFVLLRFFDPIIIFDQIGVYMIILQWIVLNLSFYSWKK